MRRSVIPITALILLLGLVGIGRASAQPGSAADQYIPKVPSARGEQPFDNSSAGSLPRGTEKGLNSLGKDGGATAALARVTAPQGGQGQEASGLGFILPLILLMTALGALGLFFVRRRHAQA